MTEKINGPGFRPTDAGSARRAEASKPVSAVGTATTAGSGSGDTVNLTRSALLLAKLEEAVRAAPVVDAEHVSALKETIAAGAYEVDADALADTMLRLERELG
jgi:negative regulator of flagellin synthesis FlgM